MFPPASHSDSRNEVVLLQAKSAQRRCADLPSTVPHNICLRIEEVKNMFLLVIVFRIRFCQKPLGVQRGLFIRFVAIVCDVSSRWIERHEWWH
ncbi:hypothetical protein T07_5936 [Trichinella nelsoni]|uniref:Uncharacterized protein n=1 Tax=Trichinella nelsoni TaxID=6336 RepID=A0A0V0RF47_9BILA|nr:hypothetical protein T07_12920 [Trichinella nelsoni]KRX13124.1 hypothetical protein T07_5936 [Trichinella nelsoni]